MEVSERIAAIMAHYGLSVKEFANKIGAKTQQAIYDLLHGKTKSISTDMENKILSCFPEISRAWLLTGEGEKFVVPPSPPPTKTGDTILIPVVNLDTVGATKKYNEEVGVVEYQTGWYPFPREIAHEGDVVIPVYNDSMAPAYVSGSMVLIRPVPMWREYLEMGVTYIVELEDDRRLIKTVMKGEDADHYLLVSINPAYQPSEVKKSFIRSVWRVIMSVRRESL